MPQSVLLAPEGDILVVPTWVVVYYATLVIMGLTKAKKMDRLVFPAKLGGLVVSVVHLLVVFAFRG